MDALRELIREQRNQLSLSLRDVATRSGGLLSYSTVHAIETDQRATVTDDTLDGLAKALKLPISQLREAAGVPDSDASKPFRLPRRADRLNRREREHVLQLVDLLLERRKR